jgi:hypothetical protein
MHMVYSYRVVSTFKIVLFVFLRVLSGSALRRPTL